MNRLNGIFIAILFILTVVFVNQYDLIHQGVKFFKSINIISKYEGMTVKQCPKECKSPDGEITGNCDTKIRGNETEGYHRKCSYNHEGDYYEDDDMCLKCGTVKVPTDKDGYQLKTHKKSGVARDPNDSYKYKKFISSNLDVPLSRQAYEEIGKDFIKDQTKSTGVSPPLIQDHEAEILGKMVWRVYVAEIEQKRANSAQANDEVLSREIQLLNKVSTILKSESDHHKGQGKKCKSITNQASEVPQSGSKMYKQMRTNNLYGQNGDSYQPITGIGFSGSQCVNGKLRNPNARPRPYNSLMNVF